MTPSIEGPLNLPRLENDIQDMWDRENIIVRVAEHRRGRPRWSTFEGPPTVNGLPALHHVWTSVYKDIYARFQIMRGKYVDRRGGWDCQGLPVEIAVEKKFGLKDKRDIEEFGVAAFVEECKKYVSANITAFETTLFRAGYWVDYERAYRTMDDSFVESVWWHLRQMWERGLVYEGHKVVPYCVRCGTALSSHELGQPGVYSDRTDRSALVALSMRDEDAALVVWTTTPWTLPGNTAVAVHPTEEYGFYRVADKVLIIGVALAAEVIGGARDPERIVKGSELIGSVYTRPYPEVGDDPSGRVVGWSEVDLSTGSGLVHIAPAFGEEDAALGRAEGLPTVNHVGPDGSLIEGRFEGTGLFEVADRILTDLSERGLLVAEQEIVHSYPHCWRCRTPLIYWAKPNWFIATAQHKGELIANNDRINWHPSTIKDGRFGDWLRNNVDWAVSRDRYWGTPIPVWRCDNGHDTCVGSRRELAGLSGVDAERLVLHRPEVDEIRFPCPECGDLAGRIAPVADVWLDSGCVPAAQSGYPVTGEAEFKDNFPADFICEAIDQTRGWFYSLLAANTLVFGQTPYRNVVCLGLLLDDEGRKMSKSLGNVIDPGELFPRFGADGVRWYLFRSGAPWGPRRVSIDGIEQRTRRDLVTLWNVVSFYEQYAGIADFTPSNEPAGASAISDDVLDRWIRSRTSALVEETTADLEGYQAHHAAELLSGFIDELSNWYIRRARRRFWETDLTAFQTLHDVLVAVAKVLAPFCPFLAEAIFQRLRAGDSVHLADWPEPTGRDVALEKEMATARTVTTLIRAARTDTRIPVRQPLSEAVLVGVEPLGRAVEEVIADEVNIGRLTVGGGSSVPVDYELRLDWSKAGPRFRSLAKQVGAALPDLEPGPVAEIRAGRQITIEVGGEQVVLEPGDVVIRETVRSGWAVAAEAGITVAIDTRIDDDLRREFHRRQAIRQIQVARRESGLEITDRIELWLSAELWEHRDSIAAEVLASHVHPLPESDGKPLAWRGDDAAFRKALRA